MALSTLSVSKSAIPGPRRFDAVTIGLHWATVALVAALFASAWMMGFAADQGQAEWILTIHRSLGVTLWAAAITRLCWRLTFAFLPPFPSAMPKLQQKLAKASEYGLYGLLLLQPLSGLAQSLARGRPFPLFLWQAPRLMGRDKGLARLFHQAHAIGAWVLLGLIGLHLLAALIHRLIQDDEVVGSMLPWPRTARNFRRST